MGFFSGGGAFNKHSSSTTYATSNNLGVSDVDGAAYLLNGSGNTITDGGAIAGSFDLAKSLGSQAIENSADLTLSLAQIQAQSGRDTVKALQESTSQAASLGYQFAMDAGRSDVATMQDTTKKVLILVGIVAAAWVLHGLKK